MSDKPTTTYTTQTNFFIPLLTLIFITLKLTGYITWSWLWVLSPMWIPIAVAIIIILIVGISVNLKK